MKRKILSTLLVLVLVLSFGLVTAVPAGAVEVVPDRVTAITLTADRLVALQSSADYGWDWKVTDATGHSGDPSSSNLYGVTALGLIDAHEVTDVQSYLDAAKSVADTMIGYGTDYAGFKDAGFGHSFDLRFLMRYAEASGNTNYSSFAKNYWAWVKARVLEPPDVNVYADGKQEEFYQFYVQYVSHGFAAWGAGDFGLAALAMGDTAWASSMAQVVSGHLSEISVEAERFIGWGKALEFLNAVDPVTYSTQITGLVTNLKTSQNTDGSWGTGENPEGYAQDAAYAIMGLAAVGGVDAIPAARGGADWLVTNQGYDTIEGGWNNSTGNIEYSETNSEALQALVCAPALELDQDWYRTGDTVYVAVDDAAANLDPNRTESIEVHAESDTDVAGIDVNLPETGANTGVFTGSFPLVPSPLPPEPSLEEVIVEDGDLITVTYLGVTDTATVDDTPPVISDFLPADGSVVTTATPLISAALDDVSSGIDTATGVMTIDGDPVGATVTASDISYTPGTALAEEVEHTVTVDVSDVVGNAPTQVSWSFTVDTEGPTVDISLSPEPPYITPVDITFTLTFGEDMDTGVAPEVTFGLTSPFKQHLVSGDWTVASLTEWVGTFTISAWKLEWDGKQTLSVSGAKDLAGNVMVPDTSTTFVIDLNPPYAPDPNYTFVNQKPPGEIDSVQGLTGAVEGGALVEVWDDETAHEPVNLIGFIDAAGNGSFPAIGIGDNQYGEVWVTAKDGVGHRSAATRLENDIVYPVITIDPVDTPTNVDTQMITGEFFEANLDTITLTVNDVPRGTYAEGDTSGVWGLYSPATLEQGNNFIVATIFDKAGNSATAEATIFLDSMSPSGYIDIPDYINLANVGAVPVTIFSDEDGTYSYGIDGVTGSDSITAGVPVELIVDLSGLAEGDVTAWVTFTDAAGNPSEPFEDTATKDTEAPAAPSITLTDPINFGNQRDAAITGYGEHDATFTGTISDGTNTVEVTGKVGPDSNINITGINVEDLADGTLTASVTQTDKAGNISEAGTDRATKDTVLPTVLISSDAPDPTNTSPIVITASFREPVRGFEEADITVGNGTINRFGDENAPDYLFTVIPDADGVVTVSIAAGVAEDAVGNPNEAARFTITYDATAPEVTVTSPNGGENWLGGSIQDITWTATDANLGETPITIEYSLNGGVNWDTIAANVANTGTYSWVVPNLSSSNCLVRVTAVDLAGNSGSDGSNYIFTLSSDATAPAVTVNSPNGGETWQGGSTQTITWTATDDKTPAGDLLVDLYFSSNGGTDWLPIDFSGDNSGAYSWTVPEINSSQCLVKVEASDTSGGVGFDVSNIVFTITTPEEPAAPVDAINLEAGWNLVSLMLIPTSSNITDVLAGIDVDSVWAYDASIEDPDKRWSSYAPGAPGDLETMVDGKGYWIEMNELAVLTVVGQELPDPPAALPAYSVVEGWNLIGFKSTTPRTAHSYLLAIDGKYTLVRGYSGSYFTVGTGENLDPGSGYWISITEPGTIYP